MISDEDKQKMLMARSFMDKLLDWSAEVVGVVLLIGIPVSVAWAVLKVLGLA